MDGVKEMRKLILVSTIAWVAVLATGASAYGKGCAGNLTNEGPSSVAQYVEQLPTSCGNHATGTGNRSTKLPRSIEQKIQTQGGPDAALLKNVATNERYGAPQGKIKSAQRNGKNHSPILSDSAKQTSNPLSASVSVVTDGSDSRLIALVLLMVGIAALVLAAAVRRRRITH